MAGAGKFVSGAVGAAKSGAKSVAKDKAIGAAKDAGRSAVTGEPRGAGGTSAKPPSTVSDLAVPVAKGYAQKAALGAGAAAAPAAGKIALLLMFLNWLKTLFAAIAAMLMNLLNLFLALLLGIGKAIVGFFVGIGTAINGFVGGVVSTGVAAGVSFLMFVGGALGIGAVGTAAVQNNDLARHDGAQPIDCSVQFDQAIAVTDGTVDAGAQTLNNARTVYSVLSAWGMGDENIAGILGNWDAESKIDPTGVETIFDEKFVIGPRKLDAQSKNFRIELIDPDYAASWPEIEFAGIGLGQWTNSRNTMLLNYAQSIDQPWHALETQLGFMIGADEPYRVGQIESMIANTNPGAGSVNGATEYFMVQWEGLSLGVGNLGVRQERASQWYAQMGGWEANHDLANSILAQSGTSLIGADSAAVQAAMNECVSQRLNVDNSDLATAAVSLAWPYKDDSRGNDGTYLYIWLKDEIFPGDPYYASCDRGAATSIRWSGTDDTFPVGAVQQQLAYAATSPKWSQVPWGGDESLLQPGDVLMRFDSEVSHIKTYVGAEAPTEVWGVGKHQPGATIMHSSLGGPVFGRSPGLDNTYGGSAGTQTYTVWRSNGAEASSSYASLIPPGSAKMGEGDKSRFTTPGP